MELESPVTGKWNRDEGVVLRYQGKEYRGKDWEEAYNALQKGIRREYRLSVIAFILVILMLIIGCAL